MKIIKPTVGRKVWYRPSKFDTGCQRPMSVLVSGDGTPVSQPLDATIVAVWGDRMVNVLVTDAEGRQFPRLSVTLVQEGDAKPVGSYVEWPTREPQEPPINVTMIGPAEARTATEPLTGATVPTHYSGFDFVEPAVGHGADACGGAVGSPLSISDIRAGKVPVEDPLRAMVRRFVKEHRIRNPETIHLSGRVIENSGPLIEHLCDEVGYYVDGGDDELA